MNIPVPPAPPATVLPVAGPTVTPDVTDASVVVDVGVVVAVDPLRSPR